MATLTTTPRDTLDPALVLSILGEHGVDAYATKEGEVWAFEAATLCTITGTVTDVSTWIVAPTTIADLKAWLGY